MNTEQFKTLSVQVTYLQRIAMPAGALVTVYVHDASLADATAVLASQSIQTNANVPIAFELKYDPRVINCNHSYTIGARIELDGRLLFTSTEARVVNFEGDTAQPIGLRLTQVDTRAAQ
ncbi:hypothetical protein D3C76_755370 [compost metagenome]